MKSKDRLLLLCLWIATQIFSSVSYAVYPVPGSYYSVLLRYNNNNRAKTRKVGRVAPSPVRLWAYFDPPATLGALPIDSIDNNIARHLRDRGLDDRLKTINQELPAKAMEARLQEPKDINEADHKNERHKNPFQNLKNGGKTTEKDDVSTTTEVAEVRQQSILSSTPGREDGSPSSSNKKGGKTSLLAILKKHQKRMDPQEQNTSLDNVNGTCGGLFKVPLSPTKPGVGSKGRFFSQTIETFGFPETYDPGQKCTWNFEVSKECQMGMMVHEMDEGNLLPSRDCSKDFVRVTFNGIEDHKLCGKLRGEVKSHKWTKKGRQLLSISLNASGRDKQLPKNMKPWGFKMTVSGYCWVYSTDYLMRLKKQRMENKENDSVESSKDKIEKVIQRIKFLSSQENKSEITKNSLHKNLRNLNENSEVRDAIESFPTREINDRRFQDEGVNPQNIFVNPINATFINKTFTSVIEQLKTNGTREMNEAFSSTTEDPADRKQLTNGTHFDSSESGNGKIPKTSSRNYSSGETANDEKSGFKINPLTKEESDALNTKKEIVIT